MYLYPAKISLPDFGKIDGSLWSAIACDQFTSDREYWESCYRQVGNVPSALQLILPEVYLGEDVSGRIAAINGTMKEYEGTVLSETQPGYIYVTRTQPDGRLRVGLVGAIDLEDYSFAPDAVTPIRSTEGTVKERIPPRVRIRENALYELPHVMLLMCDEQDSVLSCAAALPRNKLYDHDLMAGGGHIAGEFIAAEHAEALNSRLCELTEGQEHPFVFAVGDGNHSLATAKTIYEDMKSKDPEKAKTSPARYALVEVVNIYSPALDFEPIYRSVVGLRDTDEFVKQFREYAAGCAASAECLSYGEQDIVIVTSGGRETLHFSRGSHSLPVGTVQKFLDMHKEYEIDYIHDEEELVRIASRPGCLGLLFDTMTKAELFSSVAADGPLPRKTFSMGHSRDKRYYTEARKIK